jgi:hypothetical protein
VLLPELAQRLEADDAHRDILSHLGTEVKAYETKSLDDGTRMGGAAAARILFATRFEAWSNA